MRYEMIPRSNMELMEAGFQLFRNHFATFLGIAACTQGISTLFQMIEMYATFGDFTSTPSMLISASQKAPHYSNFSMLQTPVTIISYVAMEAALMYAASEAYHGRPITVMGAMRGAAPRMGPMAFTSFVRFLGLGLAFLMLLVPGVILTLRWVFVGQASVLESCSTSASIRRSTHLTEEHRGRVGWLLFFVSLLVGCISFTFMAVLTPVAITMPLLWMAFAALPMIALVPLHTIIMTLAYFDLRIRKEAYDLESASQDLHHDAAGVAPPAS